MRKNSNCNAVVVTDGGRMREIIRHIHKVMIKMTLNLNLKVFSHRRNNNDHNDNDNICTYWFLLFICCCFSLFKIPSPYHFRVMQVIEPRNAVKKTSTRV